MTDLSRLGLECGPPAGRLSGEDLGQEQLGSLFGRVGEKVLRSSDPDDLTAFHEHDLVGHLLGEARLMSDHHHGHPRVGQVPHHSASVLAGVRAVMNAGASGALSPWCR